MSKNGCSGAVPSAAWAHRWARALLLGTALAAAGQTLWPLAATGDEPALGLFPSGLIHWRPLSPDPVFRGAGPDHWDARIRERGWILREGDQWKMWYTGYDGTRQGTKRLGYATSSDGLSWRRESEQPLIADLWVEDMMVVHREGTYYMFAEGLNDEAHLLTSADGVHWQPRGKLDVRRQDGQPLSAGPYGTPTVWWEDGVWHLFYERMDQGIWLAKSTDLKLWRNVSDQPCLVPGPGAYDDRMVALNQIVKLEGRYYALYHGSGSAEPGRWCTALATSTNLLNWEKFPGNPLLGDNQSSGILVDDGYQLRLYTMHDEVRAHVPAE